MPFSSVSTSVCSVGLDEREEFSLVRRVGSGTRRHPRVARSIIGNYRHLFPPGDRHGTKTANSREGHSTLFTIQTTSYPLELSLFSVPSIVAVPAGWRRAEGVPDAVGCERIPGVLLGSHPDEAEAGGKTWEGLGSSRLERYVCMWCWLREIWPLSYWR